MCGRAIRTGSSSRHKRQRDVRQTGARRAGLGVAVCVATVAVAFAESPPTRPQGPIGPIAQVQTVPRSKPTKPAMTRADVRYEPIAFSEVPGWAADDHLAAFRAFAASCVRLVALNKAPDEPAARLLALCQVALALAPTITSAASAQAFFEQHFVANRVAHNGPPGLFTGYYEPIIKGARAASAAYPEPIYRRPPDLVNLVEEAQRGAKGYALTHARQTPTGNMPYHTRAEIDAGALKGRNLELFYLPDAVDVFFLQVQGSGQIEFPDGKRLRVAYDGKNGHPYTSIGRYLIDQGIIAADRMSLQALGEWLRADPVRGRAAIHQNKSYVFFRELTGAQASAPLGVLEIPLSTGRSLAVDAGHHAIGLPVYVSSVALTHATGTGGFHRLMVAQDVGSAIKGPERGDIYFGSGPEAGKLAGVTKHPGKFFVLTPRDVTAAGRATSALPATPASGAKGSPRGQP
jgi:membrane-bound lytic murein transglycosylase A